MKFEILFHFSHGVVHVLETRRLDLPESATPGEIYQWFFIRDSEVSALTFGSMELKPQRRFFEEGMIEFDLKSLTGRLCGIDLSLVRQDSASEKLKTSILKALKEKSP